MEIDPFDANDIRGKLRLKILLTNDDGIEAPGLETLFATAEVAFAQTARIVVVAPDRGRSECGHSVTTGRPLAYQQVKTDWYSVDGTPVDCVRIALAQLCPEVDLVISGVNAGANLGVDLLVSGTFAAAREAAIHGIDAMAASHYRRPDVPATWDHVPGWLAPTLSEFAQQRNRASGPRLWNVNLPAVDPTSPRPSHVHCSVDTRPMVRSVDPCDGGLQLKADFHGRPREKDSDVHRCFSGQITISEVSPHVG